MGRPELSIGIWPDAQDSDEWPRIEALLRPAAVRGRTDIDRGPGWHVWTVHKGAELVGAANVRRTTDSAVEVVLVGGRGFREWIKPLEDQIAGFARDEGATVMRAIGRIGWARVLDWKVVAMEGQYVEYERAV